MTVRVSVATYNIHKGLSPLNQRLVIHEVRDKLHAVDADIVLLQEVQGAHARHQHRFENWPQVPQHAHIADGRYSDIVYGVNARHQHGDHGNAILSAHPIANWVNHDVSHHRFENRGHLMARINIPGLPAPLTCVCVHLGLLHRSRVMQIERLIEYLHDAIPAADPIIIAGDFNDWRSRHSQLSAKLATALGVVEAFESTHGAPARTFPSIMPMLTLDRIYVRGLRVVHADKLPLHAPHASQQAAAYSNLRARWRRLSDHIGLHVVLELP